MSVSSELPKKCQECAKSVEPIIYDKCNFCQDLEFNEEILCNLNQSIQNSLNFKCRAFRPIFKLTTPSANKVSDLSHCATDNLRRKSIQELLESDKIKYKKALVLQKEKREREYKYLVLLTTEEAELLSKQTGKKFVRATEWKDRRKGK